MGKISVSEERVCIIKTEEITTVKESLDQIKTAIIDCMTVRKDESKNLDMFLLFGRSAEAIPLL